MVNYILFILPKNLPSRKQLKLMALLALSVVGSSCAYRFTNTGMSQPAGVRNIAFEAVYDISQKVVPSEILWQEIQRAFAARGKMKITSIEEADAILITHIRSAASSPVGITRAGKEKDPKGDNIYSVEPKEGFRNLLKAGSWTSNQVIGFAADVKLVHLRTREILFQNSYTGQGSFMSFTAESEAGLSSHYLRFEEARYSRFRSIARSISSQIAGDILR